jgi:Zn ribbon nucleic-acid-binding protein
MSLKHKYDGREAVKGLYPCPLCKTDNEITIFENGKVFSEYCVSCGHPIAETAPEFPRYLRDAVPIEITELLAAAESTGK